MHSATHAKAERLLGTHSHIHNLGLDSSLEPHAVSNDMVGEIAISPTPLIWASNLMVTSQVMDLSFIYIISLSFVFLIFLPHPSYLS